LAARGKIFVSYRRDDAAADARGIFERLGRAFGASNVFMDVDRLMPGQRFERELDLALGKCDVLVAVIGARWMALLQEYAAQGRRDYVQEEIAAALQRDIVVVPVLVGREASMPALPPQQELPENMRDLLAFQKVNVAHESFRRDTDDLIAALKTMFRKKYGPARPWRRVAVAASLLMLAGVAIGYWTVLLPLKHALDGQESTRPDVVQDAADDEAARRKADAEAKAAQAKAAEEAARQQAQADAAKRNVEAQARQKAEADRAAEESRRRAEAAAAEDAARRRAAEQDAAQRSVAPPITDCDRLAASPYDQDRPSGVAGVANNRSIDAAAAAACDDAMRRYPDVARFAYEAGRAAYGRGDYAAALAFFNTAIAKGSAAALAGLGVLYVEGSGVALNYDKAREQFEKGAERGDPRSISDLGAIYGRGLGVPQNYDKARSLHQKAAALGVAESMYRLGFLYRDGLGGERSYGSAIYWFEKAARAGVSDARQHLARLCSLGDLASAEIIACFEAEAGLGDAAAMYTLSQIYGNGRITARNPERAHIWYQKALAAGWDPSREKPGNSR
jgi:TPR repeat protein